MKLPKAKPTKRKRTPKSVKASCDRLFSKLIRSRAKCERCGRSSGVQLQCAHIYSRKFGSVRFDPLNARCLCASCHRWGHDNPVDFGEWVQETMNIHDLNLLSQHRNTPVKRKLADWLILESELKNE